MNNKIIESVQRAEQTIRKEFHHSLYSRFLKGIDEFDMVKNGDRIAVCISGGKDSVLMAKLFQEMQRHSNIDFSLRFLVMDPGYNELNRKRIEYNLDLLGIEAEIFETDIFRAVGNMNTNPCFMCAKMRRGCLYKKAQEIGCNKIALGHHFDDVIVTTLMGMIYGGQMQTMMPKVKSANYKGMELIRPMYYIREKDVTEWCRQNELEFIKCACAVTKNTEENNSKRQEIKELIGKLSSINPQIEYNIFRSAHTVNLKNLISYKDKNGLHHFMDDYD